MTALPRGWARTRLGEFVRPAATTRAVAESALPYLGLEHVAAETMRIVGTGDPSGIKGLGKPFSPGDVLYARLRPYLNKVCAPAFLGTASSEFLVFRPSAWLAPSFLLFLLNSPAFVSFSNGHAEGIERPRLSWSSMATFPVGLPPVGEQRRIVAAIDEQLSRIDAADALIADTARRLGAFGSSVVARATSGDWPVVPLGEVSHAMRYGTSVKCLPDADGPAVLRIPNIRGGRIDTSDLKFATVPRVDLGDCFVAQGDLLFVRTNGSRDLIGRVAAVASDDGLAFASYIIRARPDQERVDPRWLVLALSSPRARAEIQSRAATTAGQYNLNLPSLRSLLIPLPPLEEQRRIVAEVEQRLSVIDAMRGAIDFAQRRSAALRRSILERAFRGELVPQDPSDEAASVLLDRIRAERAAVSPPRRRSSRRSA